MTQRARVGIDLRRCTLWPQTGIARYGRNLMRSIHRSPPEDLVVSALDVRHGTQWADAIKIGRGRPAPRRAIEEQFGMAALTRRLDLLHLPWSEGPARPRCPFVLTLFDLATIEGASSYRLGFRVYYNTLLRSHMHLAAAVIVTSHATLDAARERWPDQRYRVIPLATDPWFHPDEGDARTSQPTVLYTGGFDPRKRVADLIEAVARLRALVPEVQLVLCGAPPPAIVSLAERKLSDRVKFSGYLEDEELARWYRRAWVVAYPTDMEGFGFPLLEGFASGTPVVATRVGSIPEIAADAATLVERGDVEQLADALGSLITDNQLSEKLRIAGLRRAAEFTWGQVARSTLGVYREVIDG